MTASPTLPHLEGKYEILQKLREGGMGAIYKVRHQLLDEVRVIKLMKASLEDDPELGERFIREARNAIRLRHPNIAQLYDFSVDESGARYMVIEFIDGLSLLDVIERQAPPPLALSVEVALQSLRALDYLHRRGFVHRDISPDNLMLTKDFEGRPLVKLIDLGIAKRVGSKSTLTKADTFLGKVRYAAPESFKKGSDRVEARSDIYSFGIVFYQLLTGRFPISGKEVSSYIAGHLYQPVRSFEDSDPHRRVPETVRRLVLKMLEKQPASRPASAADVVEELQALGLHRSDDLVEATRQVLTASSSAPPHDPSRPSSHPPAVPPPPPPQTLEVLLGDARVAFEARDFTGARAKLAKLLELDPGHGDARGLLAELAAREAEHERAERVESGISRARRLFSEGKLDEARRLLDDLLSLDPRNSELRALKEAITGQQAELRSRFLVEEARRLHSQGELVEAVGRLEEALELSPDNPTLAAMHKRYAEELDRRVAVSERQRQFRQLESRLRNLFDASSWDEAREELVAAQAELGECDEIYALWDEFAQREQLERDRAFDEAVESARKSAAQGRVAEALARLEQAMALAPTDSSEGERLAAELRGSPDQARTADPLDSARAELERDVARLLVDGDPAAAERAIALARAGALAADPLPPRLQARVAEARTTVLGAREQLEAARRELAEGRVEGAAEALRRAPRTDLDSRLLADIESLEQRVRHELDSRASVAWVDAVRTRLRGGDLDEARRLIEGGETQFGPAPFAGLREQLEQVRHRLQEERRQRFLSAGMEALQQKRYADAVRDLGRARDMAPDDPHCLAAFNEAKAGVESDQKVQARRQMISAEAEKVDAMRRRGELRQALRQLALVEGELDAASELRALRTRLEEDLAARRPRPWMWGVAGVVVVLMVMVIWIAQRGKSPPLPPPPPVAPGTLVLDARPWGRVVGLVDGNDASFLPAGEGLTPLRLSLPPGSYRVRIQGPDGQTVQELELAVTSGQVTSGFGDFPGADPNELLRRLGWQTTSP